MLFRLATPVVLSLGEETFFLDRDLAFLRSFPGREVIVLDGSDVEDAKIVSACETISVDFDDPTNVKPRLVVVDNAHKVKSDKALKGYLASRRRSDKGTVLAAIIRSDKIPAAWSKIESSAVTVREFKKFKRYDTVNDVTRWIQDEAKRIKLSIDLKIAQYLFQLTGGDLYRISGELSKLLLLVGESTPVTVAHLQLVASNAGMYDPWDVAEAALNKNASKAMGVVSDLYKHSPDDPALPILSMLVKAVEKLFVAKSMLDRGCQNDEVAARVGMHPFVFQKTILPQTSRHSLVVLAKQMQKLCELDVNLKLTSNRRTLIELVVLDLAS
jgi:DNA polymerase III subunit delta